MDPKEQFISCQQIGWHKGFYHDKNLIDALGKVHFEDFLEVPDDDEFPYCTAHELLRGSCHIFSLGLQKVFGYTPYIIEGKNKRSFHSFCQIYNSQKHIWYYIDARGVTTSFDEFMDVAKEFVSDEYTIRQMNEEDIKELKKDDNNYEIALDFAVAVIERYKEYYTVS